METVMKKLKGDQLMPATTSVTSATAEAEAARSRQNHPRGISKKLRSLVEGQKSEVGIMITGCEEEHSRLDQYHAQLWSWISQHQQLQDKLRGLVQQNKAAMIIMELEKASVQDMQKEGKEGKNQLEAVFGCMDMVNNAAEADTAIDDADRYNLKPEDWIQKCQELFPNRDTDHSFMVRMLL